MMKILKYAVLLSLPLALSATPAHADTQSRDARGAYQTECEFLLHGDISTLDMAEYQARWNGCFRGAMKADTSCDTEAAHHGEHHNRD